MRYIKVTVIFLLLLGLIGCGDVNPNAVLDMFENSIDITGSTTKDLRLYFLLRVMDQEKNVPLPDYKVHFKSEVVYPCTPNQDNAWGEFRSYPDNLTLPCPGYVLTDSNGYAHLVLAFYPYTITSEENHHFEINFWIETGTDTGTQTYTVDLHGR